MIKIQNATIAPLDYEAILNRRMIKKVQRLCDYLAQQDATEKALRAIAAQKAAYVEEWRRSIITVLARRPRTSVRGGMAS